MWTWLKELDRILRGDATRLTELRQETIDVPLFGVTVVIIVLGMVYGLCMGSFAILNRSVDDALLQLVASVLKVPALFFLTLAVTLPSLYVFNALVGSQLHPTALLRLLVATLGVNLAVLASFGPIVAFFCVCTTSYPFIKLLNVAVFAVAGVLSLVFLLQTLQRLTVVRRGRSALPAACGDSAGGDAADENDAIFAALEGAVDEGQESGALDRLEGQILGKHVKSVFVCWVVLFGLVGAQMGWVLRPFIGNPDQPFQWFRPRQSNFFEAVFQAIVSLFS